MMALVVALPALLPNPRESVAGLANPDRFVFPTASNTRYLLWPSGVTAMSVGKPFTGPEKRSVPETSRNLESARSTGRSTVPPVTLKWNAPDARFKAGLPEGSCTVNSAARESQLALRSSTTTSAALSTVKPISTWTVSVAVERLPEASVAVKMIEYVPVLNEAGALSVTVGNGSTRSETTGTGKLRAARVTGTELTRTVTSFGVMLIRGGVVSRSVIEKFPRAMFPAASVALQATAVAPSGNVLPLVGLHCVATDPLKISFAVAV